VVGDWDVRFDQVEVVALMDLNRILNLMNARGFSQQNQQNVTVDKRLVRLLDCDVRVVMSWDTDGIDVQLSCLEPTGQKCNCFNNHTELGGMVSRDFTGGYGPEEYLIRNAPPGTYTISAKLFSPTAAVAFGGNVTVSTKIYTNFGRWDVEEREVTTLIRLKNPKESVDIATITFS